MQHAFDSTVKRDRTWGGRERGMTCSKGLPSAHGTPAQPTVPHGIPTSVHT